MSATNKKSVPAPQPFTSTDHNWEETTIYDRYNQPFCHFNIHDLGEVTEENQTELETAMAARVEKVLTLLNAGF